jgi:hypothetical protein
MKEADILETLLAHPFETTLERLVAAIAQTGLILFSRIDHQAGAQEAGLEMPPTTVLTYEHPKGGTPIMLTPFGRARPPAARAHPGAGRRPDGDCLSPDRGWRARPARQQARPGATHPGEGGGAVSESLALVAPGRPLLNYLPGGLFGSVMGLTGLSVA